MPPTLPSSPPSIEEKLDQARVLRQRLSVGWNMIAAAKASGDETRAHHLETFWNTLHEEYLSLLAECAVHPLDAFRCPDCPHRGKDAVGELDGHEIACDCPCPPDTPTNTPNHA